MAIARMEAQGVVRMARQRRQRIDDLDSRLRSRFLHLSMGLGEGRVGDLERERQQQEDEARIPVPCRLRHRPDPVERRTPGHRLVQALIPGDRRLGDASVREVTLQEIDDPRAPPIGLPDPRHRGGLVDSDPARVEHVVDRGRRIALDAGDGVVHEIPVDQHVGGEVAQRELRGARDRGEIGVAATEVQDLDGGRARIRRLDVGAVLEGALESRLEQTRVGESVRKTVADGEAVPNDHDAFHPGGLRDELSLPKSLGIEPEGHGPGRVLPMGLELRGIGEPRAQALAELLIPKVEIEGARRVRVVSHQLEAGPVKLLQEGTVRRKIGQAETDLTERQTNPRRRQRKGEPREQREACHTSPFDALLRVRIQKRP